MAFIRLLWGALAIPFVAMWLLIFSCLQIKKAVICLLGADNGFFVFSGLCHYMPLLPEVLIITPTIIRTDSMLVRFIIIIFTLYK
jgi:hypothetical protein